MSDFLERLGKADASGEELVALRRLYRREYMKAYKQSERKRNRHYTLTFRRAETEAIRREAKERRMTENAFLKAAVQGYLTTSFVVRDRAVLDMVLQALLRCQSAIRQVQERDRGSWFRTDSDYERLSRAVSGLREEVSDAFSNPPRLQDEVRAALRRDPRFIEALKEIVGSHDT